MTTEGENQCESLLIKMKNHMQEKECEATRN